MIQHVNNIQHNSASNSAQFSDNNTKQFIAEFNFAHPNWDSLPSDFFKQKTDGLTKEEKHLYSGMQLAYESEHLTHVIAGKAAKTTLITLIFLITLISLISLITLSSEDKFAKPVSAATVSASLKNLNIKQTLESVYESTVSALLRKN